MLKKICAYKPCEASLKTYIIYSNVYIYIYTYDIIYIYTDIDTYIYIKDIVGDALSA
jgi:hypothetical protein